MPTVHCYVRAQVTTTAAQATEIETLLTSLQTAVEDAGGDWRGSVQIVPDAAPAPATLEAEDADFAVRPGTPAALEAAHADRIAAFADRGEITPKRSPKPTKAT
jgi:hypothetical protein